MAMMSYVHEIQTVYNAVQKPPDGPAGTSLELTQSSMHCVLYDTVAVLVPLLL